jgi:hypothetical protein
MWVLARPRIDLLACRLAQGGVVPDIALAEAALPVVQPNTNALRAEESLDDKIRIAVLVDVAGDDRVAECKGADIDRRTRTAG